MLLTIDRRNDELETNLFDSSICRVFAARNRIQNPLQNWAPRRVLCFPPIRATRANLIETKTTFLNTPEERCRLNVSQCSLC